MPFDLVDGRRVVEHNQHEWAKVREKFDIADNILEGFQFRTLHPSGGKGGDLLKFHGSYYIVKQVTGSDQATLLKFTADLVSLLCTGESLVARFFLHFHVPLTGDDTDEYGGKDYVVMNNWLPQFAGVSTYNQIYDLKGSADDKTLVRREKKIPEVHKRFYNVNMWSQCCWKPERFDYYEGKMHAYNVRFHVTAEQQADIQRRIDNDAKWMADHGLMDYSLVVGIAEAKPGQPFPHGGSEQQPYVARITTDKGDTHTIAYYIGIIDFLQEWTPTKISAFLIKKMVAPQPQSTVPPEPYAEQFRTFFENKFKGDADPDEEGSGSIVATRSAAAGYQTPSSRSEIDDPMKGEAKMAGGPAGGKTARP